jgi:hypothetical protein
MQSLGDSHRLLVSKPGLETGPMLENLRKPGYILLFL